MHLLTKRLPLAAIAAVVLLVGGVPAGADLSPQPLPFGQDWTDTGLISVDDDWSGVPGVTGYRGDDLTTATGTDPQTITADGSGTPVDVIANQTSPNTLATGGSRSSSSPTRSSRSRAPARPTRRTSSSR